MQTLYLVLALFLLLNLGAGMWRALRGPTVALAEAVIGAGLTGALLLAALSRLNRAEQEQCKKEQ